MRQGIRKVFDAGRREECCAFLFSSFWAFALCVPVLCSLRPYHFRFAIFPSFTHFWMWCTLFCFLSQMLHRGVAATKLTLMLSFRTVSSFLAHKDKARARASNSWDSLCFECFYCISECSVWIILLWFVPLRLLGASPDSTCRSKLFISQQLLAAATARQQLVKTDEFFISFNKLPKSESERRVSVALSAHLLCPCKRIRAYMHAYRLLSVINSELNR